MTLRIAPAQESEAPAALALLPESRGLPCEWLIARLGGELAGAAAIAWRAWGTPAGFPVSLQVLPEARRRGVGRALFAKSMALAAEDADGLWSLGLQPLAGPVADFLAACGLAPRRRQLWFEADVDAMVAAAAPLAARARRGGDLLVKPLREAPLEEAGWLLAREFGGGPFQALHGLRRRCADLDDGSLVLMAGEQLAGIFLGRREDGVGRIDARVMAPGWRGGRGSLLLLAEMFAVAKTHGVTRFRFHCDDTVSDTISMARRCGADELDSGAYYYAAIS